MTGIVRQDEQRVIQRLLDSWGDSLRLTSIPQAMASLGIGDKPGLRWRIAQRLEGLWRGALTSPEKRRGIAAALGRPFDESQLEQWREQVDTWNMASVVLREDEKLVARHILLHQQKGLLLPRPAETAERLGLSVQRVHSALRMLSRVGFVSLRDPRRLATYALAEGHEMLLAGLGFSFHTVSLETGERFGVP